MARQEQTYKTKTYDGRTVIGFKGYEVVEGRDGTWTLLTLKNHAADSNGIIATGSTL